MKKLTTDVTLISLHLTGAPYPLTFRERAMGALSETNGQSASPMLSSVATTLRRHLEDLKASTAEPAAEYKRVADTICSMNPSEIPSSIKTLEKELAVRLDPALKFIEVLNAEMAEIETLQKYAALYDQRVASGDDLDSDVKLDPIEEVQASAPASVASENLAKIKKFAERIQKGEFNSAGGKAEFFKDLPAALEALKGLTLEKGKEHFGSAPIAEPTICPGCSACRQSEDDLQFGEFGVSEDDMKYLQAGLLAGIENGTIEQTSSGALRLSANGEKDPTKVFQGIIDAEKEKALQNNPGFQLGQDVFEKLFGSSATMHSQPQATSLDEMIANRFMAKANEAKVSGKSNIVSEVANLLGVKVQGSATEKLPEGMESMLDLIRSIGGKVIRVDDMARPQ